MGYNTEGMMLRVQRIRKIALEHYEPGRRDRSYKAVWEKYVRREYGICYRTFLRYMEITPGAAARRPTGIRAAELERGESAAAGRRNGETASERRRIEGAPAGNRETAEARRGSREGEAAVNRSKEGREKAGGRAGAFAGAEAPRERISEGRYGSGTLHEACPGGSAGTFAGIGALREKVSGGITGICCRSGEVREECGGAPAGVFSGGGETKEPHAVSGGRRRKTGPGVRTGNKILNFAALIRKLSFTKGKRPAGGSGTTGRRGGSALSGSSRRPLPEPAARTLTRN